MKKITKKQQTEMDLYLEFMKYGELGSVDITTYEEENNFNYRGDPMRLWRVSRNLFNKYLDYLNEQTRIWKEKGIDITTDHNNPTTRFLSEYKECSIKNEKRMHIMVDGARDLIRFLWEQEKKQLITFSNEKHYVYFAINFVEVIED